MNNAELIKALRHCGKGGDIAERCLPCGYYDCEPWCEAALVNDAADALEAAEQADCAVGRSVQRAFRNDARRISLLTELRSEDDERRTE